MGPSVSWFRGSARAMVRKVRYASTNSGPRRSRARLKLWLRRASPTASVCSTQSTNGSRVMALPFMPIICDAVSGVIFKIASIASTPCIVDCGDEARPQHRPQPRCVRSHVSARGPESVAMSGSHGRTMKRSKYDARPPRCVWPRTVTRVSTASLVSIRERIDSALMGAPLLSTAPSARTTSRCRLPVLLICEKGR